MTSSRPVLRLVDLHRTFPGGVRALRGVDLAVRDGESVAIIGKSGSGKSTLLNVIGLLDRPDGGSYELLGQDVRRVSDRTRSALRAEHLGFVFQAFHLIEHRTVLANVELGALYLGWPARVRQQRAAELLERLGLLDRRAEVPAVLSGGERQRVAIARALMGAPRVLLCDEPTGNLDSENAGIVLALVDQLRQAGLTVLVVTHDPDVAARADRQVRMVDGRLAEPVEG